LVSTCPGGISFLERIDQSPSAGQEGMTIGIEQFRDARELRLDRMLIQPFHNEVGNYPFGHR
jgi:hypothetical protein